MRKLTEEQAEKYFPLIKGKVISLIGTETPDYEDLIQDIMLSMVKAIKIFRNEADIKSLLYVVIMRRYYDYLRKKYKEKSFDCYWELTTAIDGPQKKDLSETRIDEIDLLFKESGLTREKRGLLKAVKKTLLSGRVK